MSEIKVGEYVRTEFGNIGKFYRPASERSDVYYIYIAKDGMKISSRYDSVVKHSFNIIDLIEEEDIVKIKDHDWIRVFNIDDKITLKSFIEDCEENNWTLMSIVTHEQFQSMEYRLEE